MAIDVNWVTGVIYVPKSYTTLLQPSPEIRTLDVDQFRLDLKALESSVEGMLYPDTHQHDTETVMSGDIYVRKVTIKPPYTVEFENGMYAVKCIGANHNIFDRMVLNNVSLIIGNSGGLLRSPGVDMASVQDGLTAQGYTPGRAPRLDSIDAAVSSRAVAGDGLTAEQALRLTEVAQLLGLDPAIPLEVSKTLRQAGSIQQQVTVVAGVVTVRRI